MGIVYIGEATASFHLFFNGPSTQEAPDLFDLTNSKEVKLSEAEAKIIANASHIIFARDIDFRTLKIAKLISKYKIPYSYYADDNYFILRRIIPSHDVTSFLDNADKIICGSEKINRFFKLLTKRDNSSLITLCIDASLETKKLEENRFSSKNLSIGLLGTGKNKLYIDVIKDISKGLSDFDINIFLTESLFNQFNRLQIPNNISFNKIKFTRNYSEFVNLIKKMNLDFLIQPADKMDYNYKYKNLNSLLLPYYCGCLTLFCNNPPYDVIAKNELSDLLNNDNKFSRKIKDFYYDNENYNTATMKLRDFVQRNFSANDNISVLRKTLKTNAALDKTSLVAELKRLSFSKFEKFTYKLKRSLYKRRVRWSKEIDPLAIIDRKI